MPAYEIIALPPLHELAVCRHHIGSHPRVSSMMRPAIRSRIAGQERPHRLRGSVRQQLDPPVGQVPHPPAHRGVASDVVAVARTRPPARPRRSTLTVAIAALRTECSGSGYPIPGERPPSNRVSTLQRLTDRGWSSRRGGCRPTSSTRRSWAPSPTASRPTRATWTAYGVAIPPKDDVFPHLRGEIPASAGTANRFEQFQEHHVRDADALAGHGRTYDLTIFGIVKFFHLAMENNPNVHRQPVHPGHLACCTATRVGTLVRENRRLFLHRGAWPKFKGYAYASCTRLAIKEPRGKRAGPCVAEHGYDTKFAYHVVRLRSARSSRSSREDIDLQQRDNERLKAIRRGERTERGCGSGRRTRKADLERRVRREHPARRPRRGQAQQRCC